MIITMEIEPEDFEAWSGGADTLNEIIAADKEEVFNALAEEMFPDGIDDTGFNDWLWFERDSIFEALGMSEEDEDVDEESEEDEDSCADFDEFCERHFFMSSM